MVRLVSPTLETSLMEATSIVQERMRCGCNIDSMDAVVPNDHHESNMNVPNYQPGVIWITWQDRVAKATGEAASLKRLKKR